MDWTNLFDVNYLLPLLFGLSLGLEYIGAALGIWGGIEQKSAADKAAQQMKKAGQLQRWALPQFQSLIESYYKPQLGKESPILKAQLGQTLSGIGRGERVGLAESQRYWLGAGNLGRGRGETMRIGRSAEEARSQARLGYGGAQESYKQQGAANLANMLSTAAGMGQSAVQSAYNIGQVQQAGTSDLWSNLLSSVGGLYGTLEAQKQQRQMNDLMAALLGTQTTKKKTGSAGGSYIGGGNLQIGGPGWYPK